MYDETRMPNANREKNSPKNLSEDSLGKSTANMVHYISSAIPQIIAVNAF